MKIEILFEDEYLLAVNKPPALPVHPTLDPLRPSVEKILEKDRKEDLVLFHRLDLDTTGVLLFGRKASVNKYMTDLFRDRQVEKTYHAVVEGKWLPEWTKVESYIVKANGGRWVSESRASSKKSQRALSYFQVLSTNGERSLLEVKPQTGRTHQIRLHCADKNHPICGDKNYGRSADFPMALHAKTLSFAHPKTLARVTIEAPLPHYWLEHWLKGQV